TLCGNLVLNLSANAQGAVSYLWTPGNFTTPTISIDTAGHGLSARLYTLVATASNGCKTTAKSNITFNNCTGIAEMVGNVQFDVYPNPNKGQFAIVFKSSGREDINLRILSASGAIVTDLSQLSVNGSLKKEFDLRNLSAGTYVLILENNKAQITRQLIITK
ncbi:MAG: T9SS type A sorting domain-containing protein, partial [Bacteroidota bacterium]